MTYREIKAIEEGISSYAWSEEDGLEVWISYYNVSNFMQALKACHSSDEGIMSCVVTSDYLYIPRFEQWLEVCTDIDVEDVFPKEEEKK